MTPELDVGDECPISNCRRELYGSDNYRDLWCTEHGPVARERRGAQA